MSNFVRLSGMNGKEIYLNLGKVYYFTERDDYLTEIYLSLKAIDYSIVVEETPEEILKKEEEENEF